MRVVVEVTSGPVAGRKIVLGANQAVQVGRTEWADAAFPHDGQMSGVHFLLETDKLSCYLKDVGSTNGTFVNGRRVAERVLLGEGDKILAGQTPFVVRLEGAVPEQPAPAVPSLAVPSAAVEFKLDEVHAAAGPAPVGAGPTFVPPPAGGTVPRVGAGPLPPAPGPAKVTYTVEKCDSGLTLCRGTIAEIPPADLAVQLCEALPAYLIVDFQHLGAPRPPELTSPNYLFDWLDPAAAAIASPVVIGQDDLLTWPALVEQGWGNDAVICLYSRQEKAALLDHLRRACRARGRPGAQGGALLGYCWPSVLPMLLAHSTPRFVVDLLAGIDAVLVELPDLPETWQVYGSGQVVTLLEQLGFRQRAAEQERAAR